MSEANAVDWSKDTSAQISDEHIARARSLVGYDEPSAVRQHIGLATEDNICAFAWAYGSDNPIHCDHEYAARSRWGDVIAPGPMVMTMGAPMRSDPRPPEIAKAKKGLFKSIHNLHSGTEWSWYAPIQPGDTLYRFIGEESVEVKESEFAGKSVIRVNRTVHLNQRAEVVSVMRVLTVLSGRSTAAKRGKYTATQPAFYSDEDLAKIDAIYAAETVRGAAARQWEDVTVGDSLGAMAKGPITVSDIVCFHTTGFAQLPFGPVTSRLAWKRRQVMPAAFVKNKNGVPDIVMRMHWDDDWAKALGSPIAYDYGFMRECWLYHYLTDWCGDDAVVLRMQDEMRKFNYIGDVQTITGEVTAKRVEDGQAVVDVAVRFVNQRDEATTSATATIALPSREQATPNYPAVPAELAAQAKRFLDRHRELGGR